MTERYGWHGCILRVDLSRGKITKEPLSEDLAHNFLGGRGANSKILYDVPPRNMLEIPYPDGPSKGRTINMVEFEKLALISMPSTSHVGILIFTHIRGNGVYFILIMV